MIKKYDAESPTNFTLGPTYWNSLKKNFLLRPMAFIAGFNLRFARWENNPIDTDWQQERDGRQWYI